MEWLILRAMDELCLEVTFADLKMIDICAKAAISKTTFYRYFQNKQNAVRWHMKIIAKIGTCQIGRSYSWREGILVSLLGMIELKALYSSFEYTDNLNPFSGNEFTGELLFRSMVQTLAEMKRLPLTELLEFQIRVVTDVFGGSFERFRLSGMKDPEHYAMLCESSIPNPLYSIMNT